MKPSINNQLFDHMIKLASGEAMDDVIAECDAICEKAGPHEFSEAFEKKMNGLLKGKRRAKLSWRKITRSGVAVVIICFILLTAGVLTSEAVRTEIQAVFNKWTDTFVSFFGGSQATTEPSDNSFTHLPEYMPAGFTLTDQFSTDVAHNFIFTDQGGRQISIYQSLLIMGGNTNVDTERYNVSNIKLGQYNGMLFEPINSGESIVLSWDDGKTLFMIVSSIGTEEIIKIAEGLK